MTNLSLKNPYLVVVVAMAITVLGGVALYKMPTDLLPVFTTPAVQIVTFYPGMPPEVMERDIMSRLERWTGQSVGIEHQEGKAMLGVSVVKDFFQEGTSLDTAMSQVTSYAMSDMFYLPPGTIPPMVMPFDPTASVPLCLVTVSSPSMNEKELYDVAYFELRNRLQSISGVIAPAVYGGKLRRILSYLDREKLQARNLAPMDVVEALNRQNVFIPAGNIKAGDLDYQIFANAMVKKVDELNDIPIAVRNGAPILLRDVAKAQDSAQIQSNIVRINGRRQVYIPIYRQPGANTIAIVDTIKNDLGHILERLREMDPKSKDLALEVVLDQSVYVRGAMNALSLAAILGAILAAMVVYLFLRQWQSTLVIVLTIPLALLVAIMGLYFSGLTLNAMTLGGLALAIGILVDQAIVVIENITRHVQMGKTPHAAALDGTREVSRPILVSTLTFVVVFIPVVFLSGMAKYLFAPLAIAACLAIVMSYLLAITLIPAYCAHFFTQQEPSTTHPKGNQTQEFQRYRALLGRLQDNRHLVYGALLILFLISCALLYTTGRELFPKVDAAAFQMQVRMPSGTRIEKTEATVKAIEKTLTDQLGQADPEYPKVEKHPDSNLKMVISNIGVLMDWPAAYTPNIGSMDAFMLVQLKDKSTFPDTFNTVKQLRHLLTEKFPNVEFSFDTGGMLSSAINMGESSPIHFQVAGSSLHTANDIAEHIVKEVKRTNGTRDVRIAQRLDYPTLELNIDRTKAAIAGIGVDDIMHNLVTATNSSINFKPAFWIDPRNGNHYFIGAQYPERVLSSLTALRDIPIKGRTQQQPVALRTLVTDKVGTGPAVINHRNITRVIDVYANLAPDHDVGSVVKNIQANLARSKAIKPAAASGARGPYFNVTGSAFQGKGYSYSLQGESRVMNESFKQFLLGLILAVILVYLVMVAQFRSFTHPLMILCTVPLGFIGVAWVLYFTHTSLNIQSLMGMIMMVGIVVEYSVVLVDFANTKLAQGMTAKNAIVDAACVRLRPVLMASLTTLLALLPMSLGLGGSDANAPLARAIVGGVLGAMALCLFVVPCLYLSFQRVAHKK